MGEVPIAAIIHGAVAEWQGGKGGAAEAAHDRVELLVPEVVLPEEVHEGIAVPEGEDLPTLGIDEWHQDASASSAKPRAPAGPLWPRALVEMGADG